MKWKFPFTHNVLNEYMCYIVPYLDFLLRMIIKKYAVLNVSRSFPCTHLWIERLTSYKQTFHECLSVTLKMYALCVNASDARFKCDGLQSL